MTRIFRHGDLRLYLLKLLEEEPRHGYDIIVSLEDRFLGLYSPSPGTIYPRLQALEEDGLVELVEEEAGRKVYRLTDAGRLELEAKAEELKELGRRVAASARELAKEIKDEVRASVRDLRREVRGAARDVRREERRAGRDVGDAAREAARAAREASREVREAARAKRSKGGMQVTVRVSREGSLEADLEHFVNDVLAAVTRRELDRDKLKALRQALIEARAMVIGALERHD